jgi:DNA (cytosine-5)-methyltransferase 1
MGFTAHALLKSVKTPIDCLVKPLSQPKPRLLDLFCCAGGAATGYSRAGFEVVGIDLNPQPRYPFAFIQTDALALDRDFLAEFDVIHASPPCQSYSDLAKRNGNADAWPRLVEPVREMLVKTGLPYVIENVDGAPLLDPIVLCGTMFKGLRVLRHRLFEMNFPVLVPPHGRHPVVHTFDKRKSQFGKTDEMRDFVSVTGGGNCTVAAASDAMGINWMTKNELNEAIPPVYTQFIGEQLLLQLRTASVQHVRKLREMPAISQERLVAASLSI